MRVGFETRKLQKVFAARGLLMRDYGQPMAQKIMLRIAVLGNAPSLADVPALPPERCHQLGQDRDEQFSVDLVHPYRLIFAVDDDPVPRRPDSGIDLAAVRSIRILEVVDYHGS